jgi:hypothetical protein
MKTMDDFLRDCPGLVGDIARYINKQLAYNQPEISLATALVMCSTYLGRRVFTRVGNRELELALLVCVVADTGRGKTSAHHIMHDLINETVIGKDETMSGINGLILGNPASDSGMRAALSINGHRLMPYDEMGIIMEALAKSSNSCEKLIGALIMTVSTSVGKKVAGKQYAKETRVDIAAPYLNVLGGSTPNRFYGALNEDFIKDGWLGRWLIFKANSELVKNPVLTPEQRTDMEKEKKSIVSRLDDIWEWQASMEVGDILRAGEKLLAVKRVQVDIQNTPLNDGVYNDVLTMHERELEALFEKAPEGSIKRCLCMRSLEHFYKLILCFTEGVGDGCFVSPESVDYCYELTTHLLHSAVHEAQSNIFKNDKTKTQSQVREKIISILKKNPITTGTQLHNAWKYTGTTEERKTVLKELIDAGIIDELMGEAKNSKTYKLLV